jgi:hypothetical protein
MAKTYYRYAERSADSQVNWADISRNMSDMLTETNRVREEKKEAIAKATRDEFAKIANTPLGEHESARIAALKLADQASNQLRIQYDLLKQGRSSVKDYTMFSQNLSDNVDLAFNAAKAYQDNFKQISDRAKNGDSSGLEMLNAAMAEKFGDWGKMGWIIAPNGTLMVGLKKKETVDGKEVETIDDTPGNTSNVNALNGLLLGRLDRYDYKPKIDAWTSSLGEEKKTISKLGTLSKQGKIETIEDITSRTDIDPTTKQEIYNFMNAENDIIKEVMGTDLDKARMLFDSKKRTANNVPYTVTDDPNEAKGDSSKILRIYNSDTGQYSFKVSEAQTKELEGFVRNQMRSQYDYKETTDVVSQTQRNDKPEWMVKKEEAEKEAKVATNMIGQLWYGNDNEVDSAATYFKGLKNEKGEQIFQEITRTPDGIDLLYSDGRKDFIKFKNSDGTPKTQRDFIASAGPLLAGQIDVSSALSKGSYKKDAKFNNTSKGGASTQTGEQRYAAYLKENIKPEVTNMSEEKAKILLSKYADGFGLVVEESSPGSDVIKILVPGKEEGTFIDSREFKFGELNDDVYNSLIEYMAANAINTESLNSKKSTGTTTTVKGGTTR